MTEITVFLKGGKPIGFDAHGHTGYAECGEDIVCAAVSAITQTAAMGVSELVRCPAALEIKDGGLYLMLEKTVKGSKLQQAELILGTMLLGLRSVEQDYSDFHPGNNVGIGKDDTLFAKVDGILRFETKHGGRKCVSVYPEEIAG